MGLKCRLLGHAYGEPEVERSREEQGDEVVVTVRELQVCERCGDEQTVSQNKEVTAIRSPAEVGLDESASAADERPSASTAPGDAPSKPERTAETSTPASERRAGVESADEATDAAAGESARAAGGRGETAAGVDDAEADVEEAADWVDEAEGDGVAEADAAADADAATGDDGWETGSGEWDDEPDPEADDAVILDDEAAERDETQWPEETETDPVQAAQQSAEGADVPDAPSEESEQVTNDAEIIDGDDGADDAGEAEAAGRNPQNGGRGSEGDGNRIGYDRNRSAWPEREDVQSGGEAGRAQNGTASDAGAWPDHESDDEGYSASTGDDADLEFGGNTLTPEVNGRTAAENGRAETIDGVAVEDAANSRRTGRSENGERGGFVRPNGSESLESDVPDDRVEFYCPNCGHTRAAGATSMRAGDICPKCKQGYIAARER